MSYQEMQAKWTKRYGDLDAQNTALMWMLMEARGVKTPTAHDFTALMEEADAFDVKAAYERVESRLRHPSRSPIMAKYLETDAG